MSKHTPGPWIVWDDEVVQNRDGNFIAKCGESFALTQKEVNANARLISAAPEMLAALKGCEAAFATWLECARGSYQATDAELASMTNSVWENCKMVIAKAEGK